MQDIFLSLPRINWISGLEWTPPGGFATSLDWFFGGAEWVELKRTLEMLGVYFLSVKP